MFYNVYIMSLFITGCLFINLLTITTAFTMVLRSSRASLAGLFYDFNPVFFSLQESLFLFKTLLILISEQFVFTFVTIPPLSHGLRFVFLPWFVIGMLL